MTNTEDPIVLGLQALFEPLVAACHNPQVRDRLLWRLGYDPTTHVQLAKLFGDGSPPQWLTRAWAALEAVDEAPPQSLTDFAKLMNAVGALAKTVSKQVEATFKAGTMLRAPADFVVDLLALLVSDWLRSQATLAHDLLSGWGVLDYVARPEQLQGGKLVRAAHLAAEFDWRQLVRIIEDPRRSWRQRFFPQGLKSASAARASSDRLFPVIAQIIAGLGGLVTELSDGRDVAAWMVMPDYDSQLRVDLRLLAASEGGPGVRMKLFEFPDVDVTAMGWEIRVLTEGLDSGASRGAGPTLTLTNKGASVSGISSTRLALRTETTRARFGTGGEPLVLGGRRGTRIELGGLGLTTHLVVDRDGSLDYGGMLALDHARLVIAAGDGDGFLATVLPKQGVSLDSSFRLAWSRSLGFHFEGAAGLELDLPVRKDILGVLSLRALHLRLGVDSTGATLRAGMSAEVELGPAKATIQNLGIAVEAGPDWQRGLRARFTPPTGLGLAIDTGTIRGGGFLSIDEDAGRYAGGLSLRVSKLELAAVGLLDTKLPPEGEDGFSLLVMITARFPPIPLGFGFTLNAVGGLLGIHRTLKIAQLRKRILSGSADALLSPEDPVKQAGELVQSLGAVFPPARGRHVIGPLVEFGWGTPTLMRGKLAVVVELPAPIRLALIGSLRASLPDTKPIIELNLDVLGALDLERKTLAIDARLFDSRVAFLDIFGDAALRACWGASPNFALSVGGWHPRFAPPPGFPTLRRVTAVLGAGTDVRLSLSKYFAVTSNSLQLGARVELYVGLRWSLSITGHMAWDALVTFDPLHFEISYSAGLALNYKRTELFAIEVRGTLSGPQPWHLRGFARFRFIIEHKVPIDVSFGPPTRSRTRLSGTELWPLLRAAITDRRRWSTGATGHGDPASPTAWAPGATLVFRQVQVPLGRELHKFGTGPVLGPSRFDLDRVEIGGVAVAPTKWTLETEAFAASQFEELSEDERLSRPAFEKMGAGVRLGSDATAYGGARLRAPQIETIVLRTLTAAPIERRRRAQADVALLIAAARIGARTRFSPRRSSSAAMNAGALAQPVSLADDDYALLDTDGSTLAEGLAKGEASSIAQTRGGRVVAKAEMEVTP